MELPNFEIYTWDLHPNFGILSFPKWPHSGSFSSLVPFLKQMWSVTRKLSTLCHPHGHGWEAVAAAAVPLTWRGRRWGGKGEAFWNGGDSVPRYSVLRTCVSSKSIGAYVPSLAQGLHDAGCPIFPCPLEGWLQVTALCCLALLNVGVGELLETRCALLGCLSLRSRYRSW